MTDFSTLKLKRPMMHGSAVVRLQEMLDLLGFDGGQNDGIYGPDTERMVSRFQSGMGLEVDGICGPKTWGWIIHRIEWFDIHPRNTESMIVDRRGFHPRPKLYSRKRSWSTITGVCIHQTGCAMPSNPAGWDRLNAHIGYTSEGIIVYENDARDFIWSAQGLSARCIHLEIAGNFCGIGGDLSTLWRGGGGPHHLTKPMIENSEKLMVFIRDLFVENGAKWKYIFAHRQSKDTRIADPGEEIWRTIAGDWAEKLGIDMFETAFMWFGKKHAGRPIPEQWNGYGGDYHCKPGAK